MVVIQVRRYAPKRQPNATTFRAKPAPPGRHFGQAGAIPSGADDLPHEPPTVSLATTMRPPVVAPIVADSSGVLPIPRSCAARFQCATATVGPVRIGSVNPGPTHRSRLLVVAAWLGTGVAAGVVGIACTLLLHVFQWLAFGYVHEDFLHGVLHAPPWRRVLALTIGGVLAGLAWWRIRAAGPLDSIASATQPPNQPPEAAATDPDTSSTGVEALPRLPFWRTTAEAVIQLFAVGFGASVGREGAPRQIAGAAALVIAARSGVTARQARTVIAVGAGAGLGAVYNVPLAAAVFVWEVLRHARSPREIGGTLVVCLVAAAVAWPVVGMGPVLEMPLPDGELSWSRLTPVAVGVAPAGLVIGAVFARSVQWAQRHAPAPTWRLPVVMGAGFAVVGLVAVARPEILGNGKGILELLLVEQPALGVLALLVGLKLVLTVLTLRVGAVGGLLMPSLAVGASFGAAVAVAAGLDPAEVVACTAVGAVAVLAVTQRAPWFALVFTLELTWPPLPVVALACGTAVLAALGGLLAHRSHVVLDRFRARRAG